MEALLKRSFRPEFLNRLDEIIFYKPLTKENISDIVELMLDDLRARLSGKQLSLNVTEAAKAYIIEEGFEPIYGARPLRRCIQSKVETLVGRLIIAEDPEERSEISVDYRDEKLVAEIIK